MLFYYKNVILSIPKYGGVSIIPRKFTNSKGNNFDSEVKKTKRLNKLLREVKNNYYTAKQEERQKSHDNKKK